jgi:hypothetical protein
MKNPIRVFCLTDGMEETRGTIFCRMAKNSSKRAPLAILEMCIKLSVSSLLFSFTSAIGIRAMGSCSEFNTYNCPSRLLQTIPMFDDSN